MVEQTDSFGNLWQLFSNNKDDQLKAKTEALGIIKNCLGKQWTEVNLGEFKLQKLSGGFTNLVFKCSSKSIQPIILRIEFPKSEEEREREISIIRVMSDANQAPKILTLFPGGRLEEYIPSRIITNEERADPKFAFELGRKVADMHRLNYKDLKNNEYLHIIRGFFERFQKLGFTKFPLKPSLSFNKFPSEVTAEMLAEELKFLEKYSEEFASPVSLIHNDLFAPNILIQTEAERKTGQAEKGIMLIDYEFSMQGHRAADIVSYCMDFANNPTRRIAHSPDDNHISFCHGYLKRTYEVVPSNKTIKYFKLTGDMSRDTDTLLNEAQDHMIITHMFWGLWNLICHLEGNTQLEYQKFYSNRFAAYYSLKHL